MTTMICKSKYSESLFNALYIEIKNRYIYKKKTSNKANITKNAFYKSVWGKFPSSIPFCFC